MCRKSTSWLLASSVRGDAFTACGRDHGGKLVPMLSFPLLWHFGWCVSVPYSLEMQWEYFYRYHNYIFGDQAAPSHPLPISLQINASDSSTHRQVSTDSTKAGPRLLTCNSAPPDNLMRSGSCNLPILHTWGTKLVQDLTLKFRETYVPPVQHPLHVCMDVVLSTVLWLADTRLFCRAAQQSNMYVLPVH